MNDTNDTIIDPEPGDEAILGFDVSDETLEASGNATANAVAAMSLASTAVILIVCCTNG